MLAFACDTAKSWGFLPERIGEIELVLEETLVNVMKYAYPETPGELELILRPDGNRLVITIVDTGVPFDPLAREDPDLELDLEDRPIGCLGIFLIKQLTDEVTWQRCGERNCLQLTFVLPSPA